MGVDIKAPHTAQAVIPAMSMLTRRFIEKFPGKMPVFGQRVSDDILSIDVSVA